MYIEFISHKIKSICEKYDKAARLYGHKNATLLVQRIREIEAAANIADLKKLPAPRCHKLHNDRGGQYAVDLVYPHRLVFLPNYELSQDDERLLTKATIVEIIDYH